VEINGFSDKITIVQSTPDRILWDVLPSDVRYVFVYLYFSFSLSIFFFFLRSKARLEFYDTCSHTQHNEQNIG
jgi:hypothetical protein